MKPDLDRDGLERLRLEVRRRATANLILGLLERSRDAAGTGAALRSKGQASGRISRIVKSRTPKSKEALRRTTVRTSR